MSASAILLGAVGVLGAVALVAARSLHWLTADGIAAAIGVGGAVLLGAGPGGLLLLLLFLATTSLLTRESARRRGARTGDHRGRSAVQVLANGGVAASCGLLLAADAGAWAAAGLAGSLAAAIGDSWATEAGTASATPTWRVTGGRVEPGASGGISVPGTCAGLAGAALLAGAASGLSALGLFAAPGFLAIFLAGAGGMTLDSVLGATLEGRTPLVTNATINLAATAAGALIAGAAA